MDTAACRRQALDLLARREHSRLELERKLVSRLYPSDVVTETLDRLEADGLVDQARFAESFVRARAGKGQGPSRLRQELRQRGIAADVISDALSSDVFDWARIARDVRVRKFGSVAPADYRERARQMRFLQYRGFDTEQIRLALDVGDDLD